MQKIYQRTERDCFRCCLASILDLRYEDVPDFVWPYYPGKQTNNWLEEARDWLLDRKVIMTQHRGIPKGNELCIVLGIYGRGKMAPQGHCVVARGKEIIHDPTTKQKPAWAGVGLKGYGEDGQFAYFLLESAKRYEKDNKDLLSDTGTLRLHT